MEQTNPISDGDTFRVIQVSVICNSFLKFSQGHFYALTLILDHLTEKIT